MDSQFGEKELLLYNYHLLPHFGIRNLCPYVPGKSAEELIRERGSGEIIKLASNENPLGCSPKVKEALAQLPARQIASYPSPMNHTLYDKLSTKLDLPKEMLILSNGSDSLFALMLTTFALHTGKSILTHEKAFISYQIQSQALGIPAHILPLEGNWQINLNAFIQESQKNIALIFLANPNNPTGILTSHDTIKQLLEEIPPTTIVVIDEAYYEYAYPEKNKAAISLLAEHSNVIITRTFSKAYGLAGLRLGYGIATPEIIQLLLRTQLPFTLNQAALEAASAALEDPDFIKKSSEITTSGLHQLQEGLDRLALAYLPSHANFITFDCGVNAVDLYEELLKQGIIVRPLDAYGLPTYLRVTVGTADQNACLLNKLTLSLAKFRGE